MSAPEVFQKCVKVCKMERYSGSWVFTFQRSSVRSRAHRFDFQHELDRQRNGILEPPCTARESKIAGVFCYGSKIAAKRLGYRENFGHRNSEVASARQH